jgi:hypothetical protein
LTREGEHACRARERGEREENGQERREKRADGDEKDAERQRNGRELRSSEVLLDGVVECTVDARAARLLDPELRVRALNGGDGRERPGDPVVSLVRVVLRLEGDECRATRLRKLVFVPTRVRRSHVLDALDLRERAHDILHRASEGCIANRESRALDKDDLGRVVGESGAVDDVLSARRVAVHATCVAELLRPDPAAEDEDERNESEPTECGGLPVPSAPAPHSRGDVL